MKIDNCLIATISLILFFSCQRTEKPKTTLRELINAKPSKVDSIPVLINDLILNTREIDSLENVAIDKGDKNAFHSVEAYYEERNEERKVLTLSIMMAHKYNYNYAYYISYTIFVHQKNGKLKDLDEQTQNLALYYLARSYELGYDDALSDIKDNLGKNATIQKSSFYLNKMMEFDSKK